ncbi:hypothetical protein [Methylorubrum zatmanii]|uniref:ATPase n=1 Tax=Methylorubrum zatmanii TaxID=29429 RepID=A0ABW1WRF0_9HYPH|nr:hypothetical protein [Methylorubrum zatmanii]MBD8908053.1 hypothetical protein [Methylorubrum zatmanii]
MSEPARQAPSPESGTRASASPAPLRDWLIAMRNAAAESRAADPQEDGPGQAEARPSGWAPRLVTSAANPAESADDDLAEIMAENMMLKAKLRLEIERRDELQAMLAQEIRDLRAHITEEVRKIEDLRAERDLWRARCEALAAPLFQAHQR